MIAFPIKHGDDDAADVVRRRLQYRPIVCNDILYRVILSGLETKQTSLAFSQVLAKDSRFQTPDAALRELYSALKDAPECVLTDEQR